MVKVVLITFFMFLSLSSDVFSSSNTDELKCVSVLSYFAEKLDERKSGASSKLPISLIGYINMTRVLSGKIKIEREKNSVYEDAGLKSCMSLGMNRTALFMIVNAAVGKIEDAPIKKYEKCGEGMFSIAVYYESQTDKIKGGEMGMEISSQLRAVEKELRFLYPIVDTKNFSLVNVSIKNRRDQEMKGGGVSVKYIMSLLKSCDKTGLNYTPYLDSILKLNK